MLLVLPGQAGSGAPQPAASPSPTPTARPSAPRELSPQERARRAPVLIMPGAKPDPTPPPPPSRASAGPPVVVAQLGLVETLVEVQQDATGGWSRLPEGGGVKTGDRLRVGPDSVARLDFPWMRVLLAPGSQLALVPGSVLGLRLERGRAELTSGRDDIVKLDTPEARLRGRGWLLVRRDDSVTRVSVLRGDFRVTGRVGGASLRAGFGCLTDTRSVCIPQALPEPPVRLDPGSDPHYVALREPLELAWQSSAAAHHLQVLSFEAEAVLVQRDVATAPHPVQLPWPGLYRWRVSARNAQGLEGAPSLEGLFCVMPQDLLQRGPAAAPAPEPSAAPGPQR